MGNQSWRIYNYTECKRSVTVAMTHTLVGGRWLSCHVQLTPNLTISLNEQMWLEANEFELLNPLYN